MSIGEQLLNVPMGDMIRQMAFAIADAQIDLDRSSMLVAEMMSGKRVLRDADGNLVDASGAPATRPQTVDTRVFFGYTKDERGDNVPQKLSMLELGFTPTFYQFVDTTIETKISITITREKTRDRDISGDVTTSSTSSFLFGSSTVVRTTPVDASFSATYSYSAEGSSLLRTKLVPVPPPAVLTERIRALIESEEATAEASEGGES